MIDEELGRLDHLLAPVVESHRGVGGQVRPTDLGEPLGDPRLGVGIVDDHPAVALEVAAHRRVAGDLDALEQFLVRHRPRQVEALAHLLRRGHQPVDLLEIEPRLRMCCHVPSLLIGHA